MRRDKKNKKEISIRRSISNILFMLKLVMRHTPGYLTLICLFEAYCSLEVFIEFTYATKYLLELIENGGTFPQAARFMLFILAIVMIKLVFSAFMDFSIKPKAKEKLHQRMRLELYEKAASLDLERYDDPKCYNEFVWSTSEISPRMNQILDCIVSMVSNLTRILAAGALFISLDAAGLVFVFISLALSIVCNLAWGRLNFKRAEALKPIERKRSYFNRIFYLNDYAREIRLNPVSELLSDKFHETNRQVYPAVKEYGKKIAWMDFISQFVANDLLMNVAYLGYLVYKTIVRHAYGYGSMMALFSASSSLKNSLWSLEAAFPQLWQHSLYVEKIRGFLEFESRLQDGGQSCCEFAELTVENVSFAYDDGPETLREVSMTIKAGEKIAIVGYNGSGKTTLVKLLLRLYDTSGGTIRLNGKEIQAYDIQEYRRQFATVFQDYRLFAATLADNVKMDTAEKEDAEAVKKALLESGFGDKLSKLEHGIHTQLTREFSEEGVNLSGGEAQKVAIARTFYRYCPIIILDEPSSALDPISEYKLNEAMLHAAQDKTVVFISHRLSSTVMADRIYMLENGRVIESGSHQELMHLNEKYAEMFRLQAEKYHRL